MKKRSRGSSRPKAATAGGVLKGPERRHSRIVVGLPVRCTRVTARTPETWRGRTADVGGGGFAVELPTRLSPGTRLSMEIRTGIGPFRMEADVLWTRRVAGRAGVIRHGLCLADRSEVLDLPIGVLLGQWLRGLAKREETRAAASRRGRRSLDRRKKRR